MTTMLENELTDPYAITEEQHKFFEREGFIKLKNVLSPEILRHYGRQITEEVKRLNTQHLPMEERTTYQKAFLQVTNIWQRTDEQDVRDFVLSPRLGRIAAELMGCRGVRLYHDQALYKEPGGGITPWHADQFYWPLESDRTVTVWIPLQETDLEMGPLAFCHGSHRHDLGRGLAISDEAEGSIEERVKAAGFEVDETAFDLGEVSFHFGWTFHRAGANVSNRPREVMTMIYMDAEMRLKMPENRNQEKDWESWCPGAKVGEVVDTPLNPVIYER